ncbi:MAG: flagellar biosynthesis repressor FlbT [Bosea sp.]|uniref:flagellar biosynthesis repressor FlbT n=1 Tax=Bosea sp. (in: a-proteobacteria) TaxID=1871050 RepID=UPI0023A382FA|nr:flagellar biosynthesis repressor FlbT [Bosea sp. (in: a-proteobacteria)]MCP4737770.1 flagellar biosynthesis repressor FlbT [Bosea sp. (in: a-proteobacteria)]
MKSMRLSLRANERIFINGAILRVDRKVSFELLNDATFLLESHVLQADQTTTPLRQLYFVVQTLLIAPKNGAIAKAMFDDMVMAMARIFEDRAILTGLDQIDALVDGGRHFEALKQLRLLFPTEAAIIAAEERAPPSLSEFTLSQFHPQVA